MGVNNELSLQIVQQQAAGPRVFWVLNTDQVDCYLEIFDIWS